MPDVEQDFINGYNQSEDYISSDIDSYHKRIKDLEIGCFWSYFLSKLIEIKIVITNLIRMVKWAASQGQFLS